MRRGVLLILPFLLLSSSSCKQFLFFEVETDEESNPVVNKKMPQTVADTFEPPVVSETLPNPDPDGAFKDWATCLILIKQGHSHGNGKLHGDEVQSRGIVRQEQLVVVHNTPAGIVVDVDENTTTTFYEKAAKRVGPEEVRIVGGGGSLWAFCLRFFDKGGKMINDRILDNSGQYQIFFTLSDLDDKSKPYEIMDLRYRKADSLGKELSEPKPSEFFAGISSFEDRQKETRRLMEYTYRDTWHEKDMNDGVRDLFNIKLLPPLTKKTYYEAGDEHDQDYVGLKGHFRFCDSSDYYNTDPKSWQIPLTKRVYVRETHLLPQFFLAMRVMKCPEGKKAILTPSEYNEAMGIKDDEMMIEPVSEKICAPFDRPDARSEWKEIIRMNIPIRVYANSYDTEPQWMDPNEPYYFHLSHEVGLTPIEGYEAFYSGSEIAGWNPNFFL